MPDLKLIITRAFTGQSQRLVEVCLAGGLAGASLAYVRTNFRDSDERLMSEPDLPDLRVLSEFDSSAPALCHSLVRLVRLFLPSRVPRALEAVEMLVQMQTCYEAVVLDSRRYAEVVYFAFILAERVQTTVNKLSLLFPGDSPSYKHACDLCQGIFDLQASLYSEIKGLARFEEI
jgi:hypothetical protein